MMNAYTFQKNIENYSKSNDVAPVQQKGACMEGD